MARWIKTDGTETTVHPMNGVEFSLEEMHHYVGGYLEALTLNSTLVLYLDEEGMLKSKPVNLVATHLLHTYRRDCRSIILVGDVLMASLQETGDDTEEEE